MEPDALDLGMRALAYVAGCLTLGNQLDELFVDANYLARGLYRRERRAVTLDALMAAPPRRVAIMIPAWKEAEVIEQMLEHNLRTLDYDRDRYDIFCGTYQNDPETQARVDAVARRARNVHKVVVPHDGPTSKADCLNWVYQGIALEEERRGRRFEILLMHDAEDLIHPLSMRLYAMLIPEHDFVQTPVFSLPISPRQLVSGTYIDEFSEHHLKDMLVRQAIGGLIPSAGVGTAFAREAFEEIAVASGQRAFDMESLTEDYEIGLKLRLAGKRVCFACRTILRPAEGGGTPPRARLREEYIATREYFPDGLRASVRQRSRWILGITLQCWQRQGWPGPPPVLYCLFRDRKALFATAVVFLAYLLVGYSAARAAGALVTGSSWEVARVSPPGSALSWILILNLALFGWRVLMKGFLVGRLYGPVQGVLCLPRMALTSLICVAAAGRAVGQYVRHRVTRQPLRWLKTAHAFPNLDALRAQPCAGEGLAASEAGGADGVVVVPDPTQTSSFPPSNAQEKQESLCPVP